MSHAIRYRKREDAIVDCSSRKARYATKARARTAVARHGKLGGVSGEIGYYKCSECRGYHTTSSLGGTTRRASGAR